MEAQLFNITEIPRGGEGVGPLNLEFYAGDITTSKADVLLASAFDGAFFPTHRSVLGAIYERFDIKISPEMVCPFNIPGGKLNRVQGIPETSAFKHLWIIEMTDYYTTPAMHDSVIAKTFKTLTLAGNLFDQHQIKSISLPMIGSGYQKVPPQKFVGKLMRLIKDWSHISSSLDTVKLFSNSLKNAPLISRTIDEHFRCHVEDSASRLLFSASVDELKEKKDNFNDTFNKHLCDLYSIAASEYPSLKSLAMEGRKIAEKCGRSLMKTYNVRHPDKKMSLDKMIAKVKDYILQNRSWVLSYLRLLQTCGNHAAHAQDIPFMLNFVDASAIIISSIKLIEFTIEEEGRLSGNLDLDP